MTQPQRVDEDERDDGDWAWRRRIRANPHSNRVYRTVVGVVGALITVAGLLMVPLPGPGWLVVFIGIGVLASEVHWAPRLLDFGRERRPASRPSCRTSSKSRCSTCPGYEGPDFAPGRLCGYSSGAREGAGRVAQLVRAFASHARGQGFESLHVHHAGQPAPLSRDSGVLLRLGATVGGWAEHS